MRLRLVKSGHICLFSSYIGIGVKLNELLLKYIDDFLSLRYSQIDLPTLSTMNFPKTSPEDFSIIKNAIDDDLTIIRHDDTGCYNITKIANYVNKKRDNESAGNLPSSEQPAQNGAGSEKRARKWLESDSTKELIEACKRYVPEEAVHYELAAGTPKRFAGTYVHRYLFDHFMAWLDKTYAMKVSFILDRMHQDANRRVLEEKDDAITALTEQIANLTADHEQHMEEQRAMYAELLGYAKDTKATLKHTEEQNEVLLDRVEEIQNVVIETNAHAKAISRRTVSPALNSSNEPFVALMYAIVDDPDVAIKFNFRNGKYGHLMNTTKNLMTGDYKPTSRQGYVNGNPIRYQIALPPMYMPSYTTFIENVQSQFGVLCDTVLMRLRTERKLAIKKIDKRVKNLEKAIAKYSAEENLSVKKQALLIEYREKIASSNKEKVILQTQRFSKKMIPITFKKSTIEYRVNDYVSVQDITKIFTDLIIDTHSCIYVNSANEELQKMSKKNEVEFLKKFNDEFFDNKQTLERVMRDVSDASEKMTNAITEACIMDGIDIGDEEAIMDHFKQNDVL